MRSFFLALTILALPLAGCDSNDDPMDDDDDNGGNVTCSSIGLLDGTIRGDATTGSVSANCFSISTNGGLTVIAFDVPSLTVSPRSTVILNFDDAAVGTYSVGGNGDRSSAQYSPSGTNGFDAASGSISVTEFSADRVRGTFAFQTVNNITVANGVFDVEL